VRVSLRSRGETVAKTDLGGPLLIRPGGMRVKGRSGPELVLELEQSGPEAPDLLVGEVPLVWWNAATRSVEISFVKVRPPDPFTEADVSAMWKLLLGTSLRELHSPPGQGRDEGPSRHAGKWLRPEAIPRARTTCRRMLSRWPVQESVATYWSPPDMRGAPEDLVETDRRGGSKPGLTMGRVRIPDRVARRRRSSAPWTSPKLAVACRTLVKELKAQLASPADGDELVRPILQAAERAGGSRAVDLPVSSWPPLAQETLRAVVEARISLAAGSGQEERVPLSDVWRLYEKWLAIATVEALRPLLGPGVESSDGDRWRWEWGVGSAIVRVHAQATIDGEVDVALAGHPDGLLSVLSDLQPDVLVTVCDPEGDQGVLCVEAKRRIEATGMEASEVAAAGAKYALGIRSGADPQTPIASVIVASSAELARMHDEESSRVSSCFLLPTSGRDDFAKDVRERVKALLDAVDPS
jgi:hypothetical protein